MRKLLVTMPWKAGERRGELPADYTEAELRALLAYALSKPQVLQLRKLGWDVFERDYSATVDKLESIEPELKAEIEILKAEVEAHRQLMKAFKRENLTQKQAIEKHEQEIGNAKKMVETKQNLVKTQNQEIQKMDYKIEEQKQEAEAKNKRFRK